MAHYLITIWGDVDPDLEGPFPTSEARDEAALAFRRKEGDEHGLYRLDVDPAGVLSIAPFTGGYLET